MSRLSLGAHTAVSCKSFSNLSAWPRARCLAWSFDGLLLEFLLDLPQPSAFPVLGAVSALLEVCS